MKRTIKPTESFNAEEFSKLLTSIKGPRTLVQFAKNAGVSTPYLSKYIHMHEDKAPLPETIKKFANAAGDKKEEMYKNMLLAAGYNIAEVKALAIARADKTDKFNKSFIYERNPLILLIQSCIMQCPFFSKAVQNTDTVSGPDFLVEIMAGGPVRFWSFYLLPDFLSESELYFRFYNIIGRIVTQNPSPSEKYSIIFDKKKAFELVLEFNLDCIKSNISIILIDRGDGSTDSEKYLARTLEEDYLSMYEFPLISSKKNKKTI